MSNAAIHLNLAPTKKFGIQGNSAAEWLSDQGLALPNRIYDVCRTQDQGRIARIGTSEYIIESGETFGLVERLNAQLPMNDIDAFAVPRQESTFLIGGHCDRLLAQTCGIDFSKEVSDRIIYTRLAGVACGIIPELTENGVEYRLWVDCSYSDYLWATLTTITKEIEDTVGNH